MTPRPLPQSPASQEVLRGLLRLHRYTVEGKDQTQEYHETCAAMESFWGKLTPAENERLSGLSQDLYSVSDPPPGQPQEPMNAEAQAGLSEAYEARERGDWDRSLDLLRRWNAVVPRPLLFYLRARIWEDAGDKAVAAIFFDHAWRLDPSNENMRAGYLNCLKWTDYAEASKIADEILKESDKHIPNLVIQAAEVLFGHTKAISEQDAAPIYRRLVGILTPLLGRAKDEKGLEHPSQVSMILLLLATCHRWLGDTKEAYHYYSLAIALEPWNDALFVARGMIVYGMNPSAIGDFEEAIRLDSPLVWPYFYMAHYLLVQNRFEDCRRMCERGLGRPAPARAQSELCEFLGIALTHLQYPVPVIQRAFENAIRVDPSNDRARRNLQQFLAALEARPPKPVEWDQPTENNVRSSGQQQFRAAPVRRERREYASV
jgi:tetratricopeptide (TPR) repeat protein